MGPVRIRTMRGCERGEIGSSALTAAAWSAVTLWNRLCLSASSCLTVMMQYGNIALAKLEANLSSGRAASSGKTEILFSARPNRCSHTTSSLQEAAGEQSLTHGSTCSRVQGLGLQRDERGSERDETKSALAAAIWCAVAPWNTLRAPALLRLAVLSYREHISLTELSMAGQLCHCTVGGCMFSLHVLLSRRLSSHMSLTTSNRTMPGRWWQGAGTAP